MKFVPQLVLVMLLLFLLLSPNLALAEDTSTTPKPNPVREKVREKNNELNEKREEMREKVQERREEIKQIIATRREELKTRLAKFRDKKKAEIAERVDKKLDEINSQKTAQMSINLDKMNDIVAKFETRLVDAQAVNKDVSQAQTKLQTAKVAIADAQAAVEAQAGKDYGIQTTNESTIKADFKTARESLHKDLKNTHGKVVAARQALAEALGSKKESRQGENNAN